MTFMLVLGSALLAGILVVCHVSSRRISRARKNIRYNRTNPPWGEIAPVGQNIGFEIFEGILPYVKLAAAQGAPNADHYVEVIENILWRNQ